MPQIEVSTETYALLQKLAVPLVDTTDSVIRRLAESHFTADMRSGNQAFQNILQESCDSPPTEGDGARDHKYTHRRPIGFSFDGQQSEASTFKDIYLGICKEMKRIHNDTFSRVLTLHGRQRRFFAESPTGLTHPRLIDGTSIYAETNFSAENIVERCHALLELFGHKREELSIETRPISRPVQRVGADDTQRKEFTMTWVEAIRKALRNAGGKAALFDLYRLVPEIRGGTIPDTYDAIIRGTIENHSSDSKNYRPGNEDHFYSVGGIGSGTWGLRNFRE